MPRDLLQRFQVTTAIVERGDKCASSAVRAESFVVDSSPEQRSPEPLICCTPGYGSAWSIPARKEVGFQGWPVSL